ncbi:hypothetical protein HYC85_013760 [Camellia sinensis]|uniref:Uncharacterized protein n=1 Tax=Camellia sinensis TaxID=4442 RepID=A0A7J7H486_CAMSI|nr:hypothetical protein HYC85_013760 [Camellia sinensis]
MNSRAPLQRIRGMQLLEFEAANALSFFSTAFSYRFSAEEFEDLAFSTGKAKCPYLVRRPLFTRIGYYRE